MSVFKKMTGDARRYRHSRNFNPLSKAVSAAFFGTLILAAVFTVNARSIDEPSPCPFVPYDLKSCPPKVDELYIPISSFDDLRKIGNHPCYPLNGYYHLTNNIDASESQELYGGKGFIPIGMTAPEYITNCGIDIDPPSPSPFTGVFDGKGYVIKNLYINRPDEDGMGLFWSVGLVYSEKGPPKEEGPVRPMTTLVANLGIEVSVIIGKTRVGGLAGSNGGNIYRSYVVSTPIACPNVRESFIEGRVGMAGGLVGYNTGLVSESFSGISVVGGQSLLDYVYPDQPPPEPHINHSVGGLVGYSAQMTGIANCYATGSVFGLSYVGGLVGYAQNTCVLCDWVFVPIVNSYAVVDAVWFVGGWKGIMPGGGVVGNTVNHCQLGHFCNDPINDHGNYWNLTRSPNSVSLIGTGKTSAEMMSRATFAGWDFDNIWKIDEGRGYPTLRGINYGGSVSVSHSHSSRHSANAMMPSISVRGRTLNIKMPASVQLSSNTPLQVRVIDMRGKTILSRNVIGGGAVPLSKVPAGRYVVDVRRLGARVSSTTVTVK
ncbi:MAG: hypothetical protein LBI42_08215 [Chitinispirillales bacterium]|jgi:hypothetical protein|nr:hypothetical protein [Chitinispirillales bacterium]